MWTDPIVSEIRKERERYAKRFGYDLSRIFDDLRKSEKKRLGKAKKTTAKKPTKTPAAKRSASSTKRRKAA